jgi:single-strand DNA-binding protein
MVNRVVLVGRLVKDPELRKTNSDISFATFTLAVDNRVKESDGTRGTIFIDCRVFRDQADSLVKNTRKGSKIAIDGSLNQRNFERRDGTKGKAIEIVVDSVTFLEPNPNRENNAVEEPKFDDIQVPPSNNLDSIDLPDDDLPF